MPDKSAFIMKNLWVEEFRLQISPSLGNLGELQEHCCGEWNVPLHLAWFICLGHTYDVDRDSKRSTNVGSQSGVPCLVVVGWCQQLCVC